jgi:predicted DNA-binding transcriptional regulator AlpA
VGPAVPEPETSSQARWINDRLISIGDIRSLFKLGRTAAYELTHRPDFPEPVPISPRCYRWWASEVEAFAVTLRPDRSEQPRRGGETRRTINPPASPPAATPRRITGRIRPVRARKETL